MRRFIDPLWEEVDAASLVVFRAMFGAIMLVECWRFWVNGWIERHYIRPEFFFKYYGFDWVEPWPGSGMYWHFALLAVLSLLISAGVLYRLATVLCFFAFTYVFLLDQARYLNHFYLVILIAALMMVIPAPRLAAPAPAWAVWLFRLQFEVMYIFAGIVKVNADWLRLEPLGMWLARRDDMPLIGELFNDDWVVALASYGSIAIHIVGAPLLLFKRTRGPVMVLYFAFHLANHFLFRIGIFPWVAMAGTLLFLEPDWPRRAVRWTRSLFRGRAESAAASAHV
jgi:vitamin K-dependent gamma-carboxylase